MVAAAAAGGRAAELRSSEGRLMFHHADILLLVDGSSLGNGPCSRLGFQGRAEIQSTVACSRGRALSNAAVPWSKTSVTLFCAIWF